MNTIRIKLTDRCGNISYLVAKDGKVNYMSSNETPLTLANISDNAAELRFALEDCKFGKDALEVTKKLAHFAVKVELL